MDKWTIVVQRDYRYSGEGDIRTVDYDNEFEARLDYDLLLKHCPASLIRLMCNGQTILGRWA